MARQHWQFGRDLQVCLGQSYVFVQRRMFYTQTRRTARVCVERTGVGVTRHACACVLVCVFLWVNPRAVPHRSLNKFRAPLGNHGLVLGLNVSCFFRSLGTAIGARAEQTRPSRSRRHNYVAKKLRAVMQSNVLHLRPGVCQNVAIHASPIAINDKLQALCPLSLCPNYCLYAVTVGVTDGGVADAVNILYLSLSSFFLSAH